MRGKERKKQTKSIANGMYSEFIRYLSNTATESNPFCFPGHLKSHLSLFFTKNEKRKLKRKRKCNNISFSGLMVVTPLGTKASVSLVFFRSCLLYLKLAQHSNPITTNGSQW
jgi:hypothetical protein